MNFRYIFRSSVLFACMLSVISTPILRDEGPVDLEAREDVEVPQIFHLRERAFPTHYYSDGIPALKGRTQPLMRNQRRAARPPLKTKSKPPKPAPAPAPRPPKAVPPPPPSNPRIPGKPPARAPPSNPQVPGKPPARAPPKNTPSKNSASCTVKRGTPEEKNGDQEEKEAFNTSCPTAILTLNSVTRTITKVGDQGRSSITYKVTGGWPDPNPEAKGENVDAFAKTGARPSDKFTDEIKWLGKVKQLLASGEFGGRNFIVFRGAPGTHIAATNYFLKIHNDFLSAGEIDQCKAEIRKTVIPLVVGQAEFYVKEFKVLHTDIHPDNVMFDESTGQLEATLIDWGRARTEPLWTKDIQDEVRKQAERTFLEAPDTRICV